MKRKSDSSMGCHQQQRVKVGVPCTDKLLPSPSALLPPSGTKGKWQEFRREQSKLGRGRETQVDQKSLFALNTEKMYNLAKMHLNLAKMHVNQQKR